MLKRLMNWISSIGKRRSLGVEITDQAIKLTEMIMHGSRPPRIHNFRIEPLPPQSIDDGRILDPDQVARTLKQAISAEGWGGMKVHAVIPSQTLLVRFLKFPDLPMQSLSKVVAFEVKHNIHMPFEEPLFDFVKLNGTMEQKASAKGSHNESFTWNNLELGT
jgi:Tfp pilus assembly PilM family ATPase